MKGKVGHGSKTCTQGRWSRKRGEGPLAEAPGVFATIGVPCVQTLNLGVFTSVHRDIPCKLFGWVVT